MYGNSPGGGALPGTSAGPYDARIGMPEDVVSGVARELFFPSSGMSGDCIPDGRRGPE